MSDDSFGDGLRARREVLIPTAVWAGVPAANAAFAIAQRVMDEEGAAPGGPA